MILLSGNQEEKQFLERMKQERNDSDFLYVKGMIATIDKKVDDETSFRIRSEDDIRKWFESKFHLMAEKFAHEERGGLERERRMMHQLQEGLQTIAEIVRGVKEQTTIGLNEVHTLTLENVSELNQKLENFRDTLHQRQAINEAAMLDIKNKSDEIETNTYKHAKIVNEQLTKEMTRMEKISSTLEKHTMNALLEVKQNMQQLDEKQEKWKVNLEDSEGKKLLELHSAMKILNSNFQKISKDNKDRFDILSKES